LKTSLALMPPTPFHAQPKQVWASMSCKVCSLLGGVAII
jgi:hypothetical protein